MLILSRHHLKDKKERGQDIRIKFITTRLVDALRSQREKLYSAIRATEESL